MLSHLSCFEHDELQFVPNAMLYAQTIRGKRILQFDEGYRQPHQRWQGIPRTLGQFNLMSLVTSPTVPSSLPTGRAVFLVPTEDALLVALGRPEGHNRCASLPGFRVLFSLLPEQ